MLLMNGRDFFFWSKSSLLSLAVGEKVLSRMSLYLAEHTCSYLLNLLIQQIHIRNYFKKGGRSDLARHIFSASVAAEWKMLLAVIRINVTSFSLSWLIKISLASLTLLELFLMQLLVFLFKIHVSCKNS